MEPRFVCASCGHDMGNHDVRGCVLGRQGAVRNCRCSEYKESEAEKAFREFHDKKNAWPEDVLAALKHCLGILHTRHKDNPAAPENPEECFLCIGNFWNIVRTGEAVVHDYMCPECKTEGKDSDMPMCEKCWKKKFGG